MVDGVANGGKWGGEVGSIGSSLGLSSPHLSVGGSNRTVTAPRSPLSFPHVSNGEMTGLWEKTETMQVGKMPDSFSMHSKLHQLLLQLQEGLQ